MRAPYALAIADMGAGTPTVASSRVPSLVAAFVPVAGAGNWNGAAVVCSALLVRPGSPDGPRGPALLPLEAG